jgi:hypothetical protein
MSARNRYGVQPTHEWELLLPLFEWSEQQRYEEIRPLVLFDASVAERAVEVGISASTIYRRLEREVHCRLSQDPPCDRLQDAREMEARRA